MSREETLASTVVLEGVSKRFGAHGRPVLDHNDLLFEPGERVIITGNNAAGKTTTLVRIASGLTFPTSRVVRRRSRSVAFVPDRFEPVAQLTARGYLTHLGRLRGRRLTTTVLETVTERLGLAPGLDTFLGELSRGDQQKVSLAQAFLTDADLVVLDEPRTALDPATVDVVSALIIETTNRGGSVVVGDPHPPVAVGDRLLLLADGRLSEMTSASTRARIVLRRSTGREAAAFHQGSSGSSTPE